MMFFTKVYYKSCFPTQEETLKDTQETTVYAINLSPYRNITIPTHHRCFAIYSDGLHGKFMPGLTKDSFLGCKTIRMTIETRVTSCLKLYTNY